MLNFQKQRIYLDHNATTAPRAAAIKGAKKALIHLKREKRTFKKQSDTSHKVLKNIQHIQENVSAMRSLLN